MSDSQSTTRPTEHDHRVEMANDRRKAPPCQRCGLVLRYDFMRVGRERVYRLSVKRRLLWRWMGLAPRSRISADKTPTTPPAPTRLVPLHTRKDAP